MAYRHTIIDADAFAARNATDAQPKDAPSGPRDVFVRQGGKSHSINFRGENVETTTSAVATATVQPRLQPGFVRLANGQVTPLRAAQAMGLMDHVIEQADSDHRYGRPQPDDARPPVGVDLGTKQPAGIEPKSQSGELAAKASQLNVTAEDKSAIEAAASALESVNTAIGAETANAAIDDAIVSGELPSELPSGVSQAQVSAVVAGLTAQANAVLKETGASVALMEDMLDARDLQEARRATFLNDDRALKALGAKAIRALERLPENPTAFAQYDLGPNVKVHKKNGEHWVTTPQGSMPWGLAVRTGCIKLG